MVNLAHMLGRSPGYSELTTAEVVFAVCNSAASFGRKMTGLEFPSKGKMKSFLQKTDATVQQQIVTQKASLLMFCIPC
jgi:hypothetical protein